jgi:hypothetical protein
MEGAHELQLLGHAGEDSVPGAEFVVDRVIEQRIGREFSRLGSTA